uniref:Uncharacterized protein n=1 Tax=Anopheles dirus TaxID=7168 RepID=A0A182NX13_9DIPT
MVHIKSNPIRNRIDPVET